MSYARDFARILLLGTAAETPQHGHNILTLGRSGVGEHAPAVGLGVGPIEGAVRDIHGREVAHIVAQQHPQARVGLVLGVPGVELPMHLAAQYFFKLCHILWFNLPNIRFYNFFFATLKGEFQSVR